MLLKPRPAQRPSIPSIPTQLADMHCGLHEHPSMHGVLFHPDTAYFNQPLLAAAA